jgi:RND superfamily putative drug exporter
VISFLPIALIAVLFGLAMDYEVFMVSRIREAYLETNDPSTAVVLGGRNTTRIVTRIALKVIAALVGLGGLGAVIAPEAT